jgi:hypothetical protein
MRFNAFEQLVHLLSDSPSHSDAIDAGVPLEISQMPDGSWFWKLRDAQGSASSLGTAVSRALVHYTQMLTERLALLAPFQASGDVYAILDELAHKGLSIWRSDDGRYCWKLLDKQVASSTCFSTALSDAVYWYFGLLAEEELTDNKFG